MHEHNPESPERPLSGPRSAGEGESGPRIPTINKERVLREIYGEAEEAARARNWKVVRRLELEAKKLREEW